MPILSLLTFALLALAATPGRAQLSTVVVPAGPGVVAIPPRGAVAPQGAAPSAATPRPRTGTPIPRRLPEPREEAFDAGISPGAAALAILPLALGAALAATLPGSGGGGSSGPARTR